ncbi:hypothetical protein VOLCADRAFT_34413, partial [Volvox carteri f. nagariensis]
GGSLRMQGGKLLWRNQSSPFVMCKSSATERHPNIALEPKQATFSWTEQWYPVGFLVDLPATEPIPFSLFDTKLVVWCGNGRWGCMADECPHRRAPLSRGRLYEETPRHRQPPVAAAAAPPAATGCAAASSDGDGRRGRTFLLECAYHGWQFDGKGRCVRLPQMLPPGYSPHSTNNKQPATPAAKLEAYPTAVAQGMLWVW